MEHGLINVHECLQEAILVSKSEKTAMVPLTIKISEEVKDSVTEICDRHGTTVSEFLRKCCEGLVSDYR